MLSLRGLRLPARVHKSVLVEGTFPLRNKSPALDSLCDNKLHELRVLTGWAMPGAGIFGRNQNMLDNLFTPTHLIIVLAIALLIFGPRKLPELGKGLGEGFRQFKDGLKGTPDRGQVGHS